MGGWIAAERSKHPLTPDIYQERLRILLHTPTKGKNFTIIPEIEMPGHGIRSYLRHILGWELLEILMRYLTVFGKAPRTPLMCRSTGFIEFLKMYY